MKKSWKKGIAAAMSVLLAAGMAGCGQTNTANSTATSGDAATTAQTEVAQSNTDNGDLTVVKILGRNYTYTGANGKTVTLKDWSTEGKSKRWDKLSENLAAKGVKLELDLIEPDQFDTTIQTMAASGELFNYDMINITPLDDKTKLNLVKQGQLQSISDIWETYSDGTYTDFINSDAGQFYFKHVALEDGKCYWLTDYETGSYEGNPTNFILAFQIRQDWLDAIGKDMPTTLDEVYEDLKAFQDQDVNGNGQKDEAFLIDYSGFGTDVAQWFGLGVGTTFINNQEDYKIESPWYQEHIKDYIQYMQKLYAAGLLKMNDSQGGTYMANNQVAAISQWGTELWEETAITVPEGAEYQWFAPMRVDGIEGETSLFRGSNAYNMGWTATAVPASSDKQEAIAKILDYLITQESMDLTEYGLEGVSYEMVDGKMSNTLDNTLENTDAVGMALWCNGSIFPRYKMNNDLGIEMDNTVAFAEKNGVKTNPTAKKDFTISCIKDPEHRIFHDLGTLAIPTVEEINKTNEISTDLETYSKELLTKLIMGEKSLDDWDSYIQDLKDLGLDDLIAVQQARVDRAMK